MWKAKARIGTEKSEIIKKKECMSKKFLLVAAIIAVTCACSNRQVQTEQKDEAQMELVREGLLQMPDDQLSAEQKALKATIYQIFLDNVEIDAESNHFRLTLTEQEFKDKGLDESVYQECISNIDDLNAYVDSSGKGEEIAASWTKSKEEYLQSLQK